MTVAAAPPAQDRPPAGIGFMVAAITVYAVGDAVLKDLVAGYPVAQILCLRSFGGLALLIGYALVRGEPGLFRTRRPGGHALRLAFLLAAIFLYALSLRHLPLAETVTLFFAAPLFLTALSVPLLGETVGIRRWAAVAVGFAGVLAVMRPGPDTFDPAALLAVGSALCYAFVNITTRWLSASESPLTLVAYQNAGFVVVTGALLPFTWVTPPAPTLAVMLGLGVVFFLGPLAHVSALKYAPVSVVAPFEYVAIFWAVLLGWLVWGEVPAATTWLGIAVIVGSGLYVLYRELEARLAQRPPA
jgi:drug/metabolite transporter (DMT)-like permease